MANNASHVPKKRSPPYQGLVWDKSMLSGWHSEIHRFVQGDKLESCHEAFSDTAALSTRPVKEKYYC
jgi:hypothetical protein